MNTTETTIRNLRDRAAKCLDLTHAFADRGPHTLMARERLADWLDTGCGAKRQVNTDCQWLESITR